MQATFAATRRAAVFGPAPRRSVVLVENAHKMGSGSTKNGRNSHAQRRGVKVFGGQPVKSGGIIVRQVGSTWHAGENAALGKDYTLFSMVEGIVIFDEKNGRQVVNVYPHEHEKAKELVAKTHTKKPADGVMSRQQKRKAVYVARKKEAVLGVATAAVVARP